MHRRPASHKPAAWVFARAGDSEFRSILVKTHIIVGSQPVADGVPGQGGALLALGLQDLGVGEAGDHRDQPHQEDRGQHGGDGVRFQ